MPDLRRRVEQALDSVPPRDGASVVGPDLRLLAERPPAPGGGAVLIYIDPPDPPEVLRV